MPSSQVEIRQHPIELGTESSSTHLPNPLANMKDSILSRTEPAELRVSVQMASINPLEKNGSRNGANQGDDTAIEFFQQIVQFPAAILIGGRDRWRRLQQYLCKLSDDSRVVHNALLCVVGFLMMDEKVLDHCSRQKAMNRIFERHATTCDEIRHKWSKHSGLKSKSRDAMLAAVFLLAWFEVIRD
jgi:hypothetical protein